jgi:hypothetical protein
MGPNAQFGGVQLGFVKAAYQVVNSEVVAKVPMDPATNTIKMDKINLGISFKLKPFMTHYSPLFLIIRTRTRYEFLSATIS